MIRTVGDMRGGVKSITGNVDAVPAVTAVTAASLPSNIPVTKLAALPASAIAKTDGSGVLTASALTVAELPAEAFHTGSVITADKLHFDGSPAPFGVVHYVNSGGDAHADGSFKTSTVLTDHLGDGADADTSITHGRGVMGFMSIANHFGIAHRAHATKNDYALLCSPDGDTVVNCKASRSLELRVGAGDPVLKINASALTIASANAIVNAATTVTGGLTADTLVVSGSLNAGGTVVAQSILPESTLAHTLGSQPSCYAQLNARIISDHIDVPGSTLATQTHASIEMENCYIGPWNELGVKIGDWACFQHRTCSANGVMQRTTMNHAVMTNGDYTYLNAALVSFFTISGSVAMQISSSTIHHFYITAGASDRRIKADVEPLDDYWNAFKSIGVKTYKRTDGTRRRVGVIADEIELNTHSLIQNAASVIPGETAFNGETLLDLKAVDYEQLYRMNMVVTQQLMARVEALMARVEALEARQDSG